MDKISAKNLIQETLCNKFDKTQYRNFIINFLDGIDEGKVFTCGNAYVPEAFRDYITSYGRLGKYADKNNEKIEVLWVSLKKDTSLDRARTVQRNFVAWYLNGGRGGQLRKNALVAFYNEDRNDWRFSFIKLDTALIQDDKGKIKIVNNFTPAKRFSFLVGEFEPNHTAQSRLVSLLEKDYPTLDEIEEAFNVEKVSKEFFENYKELFLQLTEDLKNIRENESSQRINAEFTLKSISDADFCKKLLGQLVFLYFIQKKGWLGVARDKKWGEGDKQFLRHTFERAINEGKNFFNDYLEPLFYNALANGERDDNWFGELDCKIPFLNGGLFERYHDYDWVNTDIVFDNTIFSNNKKTKNGDVGTGILDVFDRYNFTVKEDEPLEKEVAVDPEMLGKVFENLLEVQDRKSKGAFYTPREIVHYMCQESLINYLCTELDINDDNNNITDSTNLTKQDIEDFIHHSDKISQLENIATDKENENSKYKHIFSDSIKNNAKAIDKALEDIKICDPAIGSGAFPVGMLNEIVRARIALVESGFLSEAKKRTTYEYKRQAIQNSIYGVDIESGAVEIAKLRLWLSLVVDEEDIENIKALPNLDYKIVCGNSLLGVERNLFNDALFKQLEELKPQFFNETRKSEKRRLKKQIDATIKELTKDGTFDFEIYFSEVFHEKDGFDVVIGNPPYIQLQKFKGNSIQKLYKDAGFKTYDSNGDIYCLFYEKGINLLKTNGNLCFITSNKWMRAGYGEKLRNLFVQYNPIQLIDFGGFVVFDSATVDVNILLIEKKKYKNNTSACSIGKDFDNLGILRNYIQKHIVEQNYTSKTWCILNQIEHDIKKKVEQIGIPLKDWNINIYRGILTGLNEAFIIDEATKNNLISQDIKNQEIIKPLLRGRDIQRYKYNFENRWLINTHNGTKDIKPINIDDYPIVKNFLNQFYDKLKNRDDQGYTPYNLRNCAYIQDFNYKKIVWAETIKIYSNGIRNYPRFALVDENYYLDKTAFFIKAQNQEFMLGILNSKLFEYLLDNGYSNNLGSGSRGLQKNLIENLPIIEVNNDIKNKIKQKVKLIIDNRKSKDFDNNKEFQQKVNEYETQIDIMVYKLYELTYDEVLTIDEDFCFSEQEYNNYQL